MKLFGNVLILAAFASVVYGAWTVIEVGAVSSADFLILGAALAGVGEVLKSIQSVVDEHAALESE
jgi:hypothetical protein